MSQFINMENMYKALILTGQGMLGIFVTILLIMLIIMLVRKIDQSLGKKDAEIKPESSENA